MNFKKPTIETFIIGIEKYYGELPADKQHQDGVRKAIIQYVSGNIDPNKYGTLYWYILRVLPPTFMPGISAIEDAIKAAAKDGLSLRKNFAPKKNKTEEIPEEERATPEEVEKVLASVFSNAKRYGE